MKTVVIERNAYGPRQHRFQPGFVDFAHHYGFAPELCRPYRAKTKGKVERMNGYLRRSFFVPLATTLRQAGLEVDVEAANVAVRKWLREVANERIHGTTGHRPSELFVQERGQLLPLAADYPGLVKAAPMKPAGELKRRFAEWVQPLQHPLSVYERLLGENA